MGRSGVKETSSAEETQAVARKLAQFFEPGSVIALDGELGAGKTTFVKGVVSEITGDAPEQVLSPTFTYLNIYEGLSKPVYHFDLYRLSSADEFLDLGFEEYLFGDGVCCLEWSERVTSLLPSRIWRIKLLHLSEEKRIIQWDY